ncbi:MAG: hypothetical protein KGI38_00140 [Thaumarchaeota archaeon]|nr:hypothetical protein [Nitrososphaerota archaeon]
MKTHEDTAENEDGKGGTAQWPPHHWLDKPDIRSIAENFWKPNYDKNDLAMYNRFLEILRLSKDGLNGEEIGRALHMNNVRAYLTGRKKSFLTHLRTELDKLGLPAPNSQFLPLHLKPRGTPAPDWIEIPKELRGTEDIATTLSQLQPNKGAFEAMSEFGYHSQEELITDRTNMFAFFLGSTIGDCSKPVKGQSRFPSMAIALTLSEAKPNSLRFGQYTALCAQASTGLMMHRIRDAETSPYRFTKSSCLRWLTEASPLWGWVFHDCLGLLDAETTTRDPVRMNWLLAAPTRFKVHLLQGVSESDGWVDPGMDRHCFVSSPNSQLFAAVLASLGVVPRIDQQPPVEIIRIPTEDAARLELFSPRIHSEYFERLQVMSKATSFPPRKAIPSEVVKRIQDLAKEYTVLSDICFELAKRHGVKVSSATVKKYTT